MVMAVLADKIDMILERFLENYDVSRTAESYLYSTPSG